MILTDGQATDDLHAVRTPPGHAILLPLSQTVTSRSEMSALLTHFSRCCTLLAIGAIDTYRSPLRRLIKTCMPASLDCASVGHICKASDLWVTRKPTYRVFYRGA